MAKMAEDPRRRAERRRALELLDASCDGCTEAIMQARGVTIEMLADLVRDGLATVHRRPRACAERADGGCACEDHRGRAAGARNLTPQRRAASGTARFRTFHECPKGTCRPLRGRLREAGGGSPMVNMRRTSSSLC